MTAAYGTIARVDYGTRTNVTQALPSGTADGDFLLWYVVTGNSTAVTPAFPGGWTQIGSTQSGADSGGFDWVGIWGYRVASSEPSDYTATHSSCGSESLMIRITGDGTLSIDVSSNNHTTGSGITTTATGVDPTVADGLLVFISLNWNEAALSPPTSMTERQDGQFLYLATQALTVDTATGNKTQTHGSDPWFGNLVVIKDVVGGGAFSLDIDAGSYALTGQAVTLTQAKLVDASAGSYALTGQDVTLTRALPLAVDAGSYTLTGQAVTLTHAWLVDAAAGSYALTGQDVSLQYGKTINVDAGSYALTGQDVTFDRTYVLDVAAGSYALSGQAVSLELGRAIAADAGSYALTGQTVALDRTYVLDAAAGSYALTGQDVTFQIARLVDASAGSYTITGQDVDLELASGQQLVADAGSYALTGDDVSLINTWVVDAESGTYAITGGDVGLTINTVIEETPPVTVAGGATSYAPKTLKQLAREKRKQIAAEARARVMRAVEVGAVNDNKGLAELLADVRQEAVSDAPQGMSRQEMDDLFRRIGDAARRALQEQEDDDEIAFLLAV